MANEGIMALPQGMDMPAEEAQNTPISVTSADSYDAAQTALGMVDPGAQQAAKQAVREAIGDLQLDQEQLDMLMSVFEYISQHPGEYAKIIQELVRQGYVEEGDMPDQYDPEFIGMVLVVLNEMQLMRAQGAMEPMLMSPVVEGLEPVGMAEGGLADVASYLASQGRNGDSMLAHITPEEAELLRSRGGSGTINPVTGLPEFFLKKAWKAVTKAVSKVVKSVINVTKKVLSSPIGRVLGTIALATVLGPAGIGLQLGSTAAASAAINMGIASAGTTLLGGGSLKDALVSGAMGYIGGGGTIMGASPIATVGKYLPGAAGGALNTGLSTGVLGAGIGKLAGMSTADALKMGLTSGAAAGAMKALGPTSASAEGAGEGTPAEGTGRFKGLESAGETGTAGRIGDVGTAGRIGDAGTTGTAQDILGGGLKAPTMSPSMSYDPLTGSFKPSYSLMPQGAPSAGGAGMEGAGAGLRLGGPSVTGAPGMGEAMGAGLRPNTTFGPADYSVATGGKALGTNYSLSPAPTAPAGPAAPPSFIDRMTAGAKDLYNEYLSPDRPGLPADAGMLRKYGPLIGAGLATTAALGGTKGEPANQNPAFDRDYTGTDYMRDNPGRFSGGLDLGYSRPNQPRSPIVETPSYASIPVGQPGMITPGGITQSPGGVAQPYNVAGLYGVPLIYGPNGQIQRLAKGGQPQPTHFPRKTGPINGPGTGTSDDIPAMLSDGEFVFTAKAVRNAGGGSRRKGAARMYKLMKKLEGGAV